MQQELVRIGIAVTDSGIGIAARVLHKGAVGCMGQIFVEHLGRVFVIRDEIYKPVMDLKCHKGHRLREIDPGKKFLRRLVQFLHLRVLNGKFAVDLKSHPVIIGAQQLAAVTELEGAVRGRQPK